MNFDTNVIQVAVEDIIPNRSQPRLVFDDSLKDLASSIKQHGIIQPLVLRRAGDKYEIVAGERRYRAATMAGLVSVPAVVALIDSKTSAEMAIVENVQRKNLSAIEEAKSYQALLNEGLMSAEDLSKKIGISLESITNKLKLLTLSPEVQDAILNEKISERHGRALLVVDNHDEQNEWLEKIISDRINVRALIKMLDEKYSRNSSIAVDIESIKKNASNIDVSTQSGPAIIKQEENFAPINIGDKKANKFFNVNSLENEAANMQMTEISNVFEKSGSFNETIHDEKTENEVKKIDSEPVLLGGPIEIKPDVVESETIELEEPINQFAKEETEMNEQINEPETLETLDFEPAPLPTQVDVDTEVNTLVNSLKESGINASLAKNDLNTSIMYIINIDKSS